MARGQQLQVVLTKLHVDKSQTKCEVVSCKLVEDEAGPEQNCSQTFWAGKGVKGGGKGAWGKDAWGKGFGKGWPSWSHGKSGAGWNPAFWGKGSGAHGTDENAGLATAVPTELNDGELEWKLAVLRQLSGNSCDAFLRSVLVTNHGDLQPSLDAVRA